MSDGVATTEPREAVVYLLVNTRVQSLPPRRRSVSFYLRLWRHFLQLFTQNILLAALMTFPSRSSSGEYPPPALLFPYTKECVPCSPLPYLDIGTLFYTGGKKTKQGSMVFFFLMFLPLIGFAIWGFGKTIWQIDSP